MLVMLEENSSCDSELDCRVGELKELAGAGSSEKFRFRMPSLCE
jgi:hypothetical protein